ncbi:hypothetical protein LuPra_00931 [Luteitalea pratensis]|uniref:Ketopantoate reductase C-terminal domain-containing protein n=1 Tax=Luteitalea pratensis TaxID=1855912 RepID=A0A143PHJ7_LUTPR|nr:hypothetical protein LuPra_00931 [Luteitalea pratensis]
MTQGVRPGRRECAAELLSRRNARRAVVRIGQELGEPTPMHNFIAAVLTPHVNGAR